jgi:hypothetical protein
LAVYSIFCVKCDVVAEIRGTADSPQVPSLDHMPRWRTHTHTHTHARARADGVCACGGEWVGWVQGEVHAR